MTGNRDAKTRDVKTRLASRSSIFGGSLSTRDAVRFGGKTCWRDTIDQVPVYAAPAPKKRRSFKEIVSEAMVDRSTSNGVANLTPDAGARRDATQARKVAQSRPCQRKTPVRQKPPPPKPQKLGQLPRPVSQGPVRPQMKGTFYGSSQPMPALVPVREMPSYSDQTDLSDLIDDGALSDDGEWASEFVDYLGSYAVKDFSAIDSQRNNKMQATGEEIFEAEKRTLKIAKEVDLRELQRERMEETFRGKRRKNTERVVIID